MTQLPFEIVGDRSRAARWLLTAEHASIAVPPPLRAETADCAALQTHWGYDIGVAAVVRALASHLPAVAVLAGFSRLVIDANRQPAHPHAIRCRIEGALLSFNADVDPGGDGEGIAATPAARAEHQRRVEALHAPYHNAIDALLAEQLALPGRRAPLRVLSVHSFTPVLGGETRWMQAGVLYDDHEPEALALANALAATGLITARNEPYSGRQGLIYAAQRHGRRHGVPYLELELRQDGISDDAGCAAMAARVAAALEHFAGAGPA